MHVFLDQQSFWGRGVENSPYNPNIDEGQPTHSLPPADWLPDSAYPQGPPASGAFQGPPYFSPRPYTHPYHPQSPHVAGVTRGLLTWERNQQTAPPARPFRHSGTDNNAGAAPQRGDDELQRIFRRDPVDEFQPALRFTGTLATRMPNTSTHLAQANVAQRLDEVEERSEEERKQRLRLEAKVDENAQALAAILSELKGIIHSSPQTLYLLG